MLRDVATKDLVEELSRRQGVKVYKAGLDSKYEIKVFNQDLTEEELGTTVISEHRGSAVILEVID